MKNFDYDNGTSENIFLHVDICLGTQLGAGGGRPPLPFIENKKKCPDFRKNGSDWFHP